MRDRRIPASPRAPALAVLLASASLVVGVSRADPLGPVQASPAIEQERAGDAVKARPTVDVTGEAAPVADGVDRAAMLMPAWETGKTGAIPPSAAPDVVGAFRFMCTPGQLSYDDPIVYPRQPGRSHLHQFFGNTLANAGSTYDTLRRTGESTCMNALNRSAYWIPAMLTGGGQVVRPDYVSIYYKRLPQSSPACRTGAARCAPIPRGLRFVFGFDMVTGKPATGAGYFNCDGKGAQQGHSATIAEAAVGCPSGARLGAVINAPNCWDGKRLDSANHRDHVAYQSYGSWGYPRCPSSHPVLIPTFTLGAWYTTDDTLRRDRVPSWHLSSDEMPGMTMAPGSTLHADWFGAWDDATQEAWTAHCIDRMLNCSGGDLGDGTQLRQAARFSWEAKPRLVVTPRRPG